MKKNFFTWILASAAIILSASLTYAQSSKFSSGTITVKSIATFKAALTSAESDKVALESLKAMNSRAFMNFSRDFKDAKDINITATAKAIFINCTSGDARNRVYYNKKGRWVNTIKTYDNSKLAQDIRDMITDAYPRFDIFGVVLEVHVGSKMAHLVLIENDKAWKRIKVVEGEMEEYEAYNKPRSEK